ncbi:MAG: hypothetical protein Q8O19_07260, partial [Rectinemataceae bacterium]|nr:hypothetical protein [Rectinemataceae bacterium]
EAVRRKAVETGFSTMFRSCRNVLKNRGNRVPNGLAQKIIVITNSSLLDSVDFLYRFKTGVAFATPVSDVAIQVRF